MAKFEVIERYRGAERVITTTRRENGAIAERDIAAESAYRNALKHAEAGGCRAVIGAGHDPNEVVIVFYGEDFYHTYVYTYRRVGGAPEQDLTDALLASLMALEAGNL